MKLGFTKLDPVPRIRNSFLLTFPSICLNNFDRLRLEVNLINETQHVLPHAPQRRKCCPEPDILPLDLH